MRKEQIHCVLKNHSIFYLGKWKATIVFEICLGYRTGCYTLMPFHRLLNKEASMLTIYALAMSASRVQIKYKKCSTSTPVDAVYKVIYHCFHLHCHCLIHHDKYAFPFHSPTFLSVVLGLYFYYLFLSSLVSIRCTSLFHLDEFLFW